VVPPRTSGDLLEGRADLKRKLEPNLDHLNRTFCAGSSGLMLPAMAPSPILAGWHGVHDMKVEPLQFPRVLVQICAEVDTRCVGQGFSACRRASARRVAVTKRPAQRRLESRRQAESLAPHA
jgi:hypothetical protein